MNIKKYFERINYTGNREQSMTNLSVLQEQHVKNIPFENIDIINHTDILLNTDLFYEKVVERYRGGICYELNGLFNHLLKELGFKTYLVKATISGSEEPKTHACLVVEINQRKFLVDVGYGDISRKPIPFDGSKIEDLSGAYFLKNIKGNKYDVIKISNNNEKVLYTLYDASVELNSFSEALNYNVNSPQSVFNKYELATVATDDGRVTLSGKTKLIITTKDRKEKIVVTEYFPILKQYFGIILAENS